MILIRYTGSFLSTIAVEVTSPPHPADSTPSPLPYGIVSLPYHSVAVRTLNKDVPIPFFALFSPTIPPLRLGILLCWDDRRIQMHSFLCAFSRTAPFFRLRIRRGNAPCGTQQSTAFQVRKHTPRHIKYSAQLYINYYIVFAKFYSHCPTKIKTCSQKIIYKIRGSFLCNCISMLASLLKIIPKLPETLQAAHTSLELNVSLCQAK